MNSTLPPSKFPSIHFNSTQIYAMLAQLKISQHKYSPLQSQLTLSLDPDDSLDEYHIIQSVDNWESNPNPVQSSLIFDNLQSSRCFYNELKQNYKAIEQQARIMTQPTADSTYQCDCEEFSFRGDQNRETHTGVMPQIKQNKSPDKSQSQTKLSRNPHKFNKQNRNQINDMNKIKPNPKQIKQIQTKQMKQMKQMKQTSTKQMKQTATPPPTPLKKCNITPHKFSNYTSNYRFSTQSYLQNKKETESKRRYY